MSRTPRPLLLRLARGLLAFALSAALLFAAFEVLLRIALRVESGPLRTLVAPWRYGNYSTDDAYWEMQVLGGPAGARFDLREYDPRYGWRCVLASEGDLEHRDEADLAGRRPLLLFGDSYAGGVVPNTWRDFPEYLERCDLAGEFGLLNYGVGGYGLDQVWLQMRAVLDRHAPARPVVLVSLLINDDLDRCVLAFRSWPKPRLAVRGDRLVGDERPVPRMAEYFESHASVEPFLAVPFLANYLDRATGSRRRRLEVEKQDLARALLTAIVGDLRAHELPFLFVIFHHSWSLKHPQATAWRVPLVADTLDGLDAPWVTVRPALLAHADRTGRAIEDYFLPPEHPSSGHYNALGDAVSFEVMREGLLQHLGVGQGGNLVLAQDVHLLAGGERADWREHDEQLADSGLAPPYLWTVLDERGQAAFRWSPGGAALALRARATVGRGDLLLECERDGAREVQGERFAIELAGVDELVLHASGSPGARVVLSEVALEPARRVPPPLGPDPN